ncbi:MAG: hypothetical protein JRM79_00590 [Nitrososphaerota archaeon]|jgi:hypothetical protein|nr:hypothetical protein [Nitrososphaerota archaeon]MCL5672040.1 hypothetical protein [Nitrososphaerota archaeon]MDG6903682.1 hypothetical protein [Nitrososphaerota archaeon]MDG6911991.1 hypothetical protein [Nitrososphaerota archaeon]MDG6924531.1 hypothetical protein [Nitrososphaerota archaeon]
MELKPSKGLKVNVNAQREAIFGDESVNVQKVTIGNGARTGVMTGRALVGFCEVEMKKLDGGNHWYPIEDLTGENGEKIVEEEIPVELDEGEGPEEES